MKYMSCPQCRKRMRKFQEDSDRGQIFYVCPNCGNRCTYLMEINGISDVWPRKIFNEAVRSGVLAKDWRVL